MVIIYQILNKVNKKSYIGQTIRQFSERYKAENFEKYTHNNILKQAIKKYGKENFCFYILEDNISTMADLNKKEIYYIKKFNSITPNGYNIKTGGNNGTKTYYLKKYTGEIIHIENLQKFCKENNFKYKALTALVQGRTICSNGYGLIETDLKYITKPKLYKLIDPNGNIHKFYNVTEFCKKHKLKRSSIFGLLQNKNSKNSRNSNHGWTACDSKTIRKDQHEFIFKHRNGFIYKGTSQIKFIKEHNLTKKQLYTLLKNKTHLDWEIIKYTKPIKKTYTRSPTKYKKYKIKNIKTNEIIIINNLPLFCKEQSLKYMALYNMITRRSKKSQGYTLP